jgi:hypothetical protein
MCIPSDKANVSFHVRTSIISQMKRRKAISSMTAVIRIQPRSHKTFHLSLNIAAKTDALDKVIKNHLG